MFADKIEQMKLDFTDKYVLVDATRPELARFRDVVGRVKTVNMNGRALVEFDEYHLNIGWYDIAPEFLKVVDKPPPKAPKTEAKKAPAPAAKKPPGEPASAGGAPARAAGKPSVADILAAARGKPGAAPAAKPAAAPKAASPAAPKVDRSKMSVADMLAAARAGGAAGAAPAAPKAAASAPAEEAEEAPAPAPVKKAAPAAAKSTEKVDKSKMSIDDMIAWCRQHDAK